MAGRVRDFSQGDVKPSDVVIIFGTGDVAQLTHYGLTAAGVHVAYFCDPLLRDLGTALRDVPVISPSELEGFDPASTCVFDAWDHTRYARQPALLERFPRLFISASLLQRTDLGGSGLPVAPEERERRVTHYANQCRALVADSVSLRLRSLDVVVTEACTMRCVDCSNLMQYYAHPRHSDSDELFLALDRLLEAVDGVDEFRVLGGEPFANPRVGGVISRLTGIPDAQRVVVYTNATIVPRGENLASLAHPKVLVKITDYGDQSTRHDQFCDEMTRHAVSWVSQKPTWTDSGRIGLVVRTPEELERTFRDCCVNDLVTLLNGRLYLCPFSANAVNLGAIPGSPGEVIDLRDERSAAELRRQIERLYRRTPPLTACSYCRGRDHTTPTVEPAIQVRRPLPLSVISRNG